MYVEAKKSKNKFLYLEKMYKAKGKGSNINKSCTGEPNPSETNEKCQEFKSIMDANHMPKPGEAIVILFGKNKTKC